MRIRFKNSILFLSALLSLASAQGQVKKHKKTYKKRKPAYKVTRKVVAYKDTSTVAKALYQPTDSTTGDSIYSFAKSHLGIRYRYGGADPRGFDCSGFVLYCFKHFGIKLPHEAGQQMRMSKPQTLQTAKVGDIIYFGYYNRRTRSYYISHSGIVASTDGGKIWFIHSASNVGIRLDCLDQAWYKQRFVGIGRVIEPKTPIMVNPEPLNPMPSN